MIRTAVSSAVVAVFVLAVNASVALGAGTDPTKVGENAKAMVSPNAKAIWWICLVAGLIYAGASQRRGRGASIIGGLAIAGIVIYNPVGVGDFMQGVSTGLL